MSAPPVVAPQVHSVTVAEGVTIDSSMTPEQRFAAVAKLHGVTVTTPTAPPQFHTESTALHMARGDAEARVDRKAVEALGKSYSTLDAKSRGTYKAAYETDLRALYDGQASPGNLSKMLDKAERDARVQTELSKGLAEGKTPAELKAILDGALGDKPRDAAGTFTPVAPQGTPAERAAEAGQAEAEIYARAMSDLVPITTDGFVPVSELSLRHTSGYSLPASAVGASFAVSALETLYHARQAGVSQEQVTAILKAQLKAGA